MFKNRRRILKEQQKRDRVTEKLNKINEKINKYKVREGNLRDKYDHLYKIHYDDENTSKIKQINESNKRLLEKDTKRTELPELLQIFKVNES